VIIPSCCGSNFGYDIVHIVFKIHYDLIKIDDMIAKVYNTRKSLTGMGSSKHIARH
jgi:hypothetical protein